MVKTLAQFVSLVLGVFLKSHLSIFTYQKSSQIFVGYLCRPLSGMGEIEEIYPISIKYTKYTTSDPYWMQNNLLFDIIFYSKWSKYYHSNTQHYLTIACGAPSLRSNTLASQALGPKNLNICPWYGKNRVNFQALFFSNNYTFKNNFRLYTVICFCLKDIIIVDWYGKGKCNPRRYYIFSSKMVLFETRYFR